MQLPASEIASFENFGWEPLSASPSLSASRRQSAISAAWRTEGGVISQGVRPACRARVSQC